MSTPVRWAISAGFGLLMLCPVVASTYSLLQPPRHWAEAPVQICVKSPGHNSITQNDSDGGVTATIQALNGAHPQLAGTGWNVTSVGPVVNAQVCNTPWRLGDGVPTIALTEMIKGTCVGSCLAATFTGFYSCPEGFHGGDTHCQIDDSDVETRKNSSNKAGGPYYSLYEPCASGKEWSIEAIMVHEVGHQLGLGHSDVPGSTMYPSVTSCNADPATLAPDDRAALDALY